MIPWPFLFCQKPIVRAPVCSLQISTVTGGVVIEKLSPVTVAVVENEAHVPPVIVTFSVTVYVWSVNGLVSVAVNVPSVTGLPPLKVSVTVTLLLTFVGLPFVPSLNVNVAGPLAEPSGVPYVVALQVAVAVLVKVVYAGCVVSVQV